MDYKKLFPNEGNEIQIAEVAEPHDPAVMVVKEAIPLPEYIKEAIYETLER